jgi:hypothetical protein
MFCDDWTAKVEGAFQAGKSWFKREVSAQLVLLRPPNGKTPHSRQVSA